MLLLLHNCMLIDEWNFPRIQLTTDISFKPLSEKKNTKTKKCSGGGNDIWPSAPGMLLASCSQFSVKISKNHQPWVTLTLKHKWSSQFWNPLCSVYSFIVFLIFKTNLIYSASDMNADLHCPLVLCLAGRMCFIASLPDLNPSNLRKHVMKT